MADNFFCLDIGEKFTKIADASKKGNVIEISHLGKIATDEYFFSTEAEKSLENQTKAITTLYQSLKLTKKNVNVVIPGSFTYSQILTMPALNEKELISAIKYQADQFIPMPVEETNIDLEVVAELPSEKKILILIVAAPKKLIEKVQNTVEAAGLIPEIIESELSASSRLVSVFAPVLNPGEAGGVVALNFGVNSTNLSYFEPGTYNIKESHTFSVGYQLFLKEIQINSELDKSRAEEVLLSYDAKNKSSLPVETITRPLINEFVGEIKRFTAGKKVSAIYLFNNVSRFPALPPMITEPLGIKAVELNPYSLSSKTPLIESLKREMSIYVTSLGGNLR